MAELMSLPSSVTPGWQGQTSAPTNAPTLQTGSTPAGAQPSAPAPTQSGVPEVTLNGPAIPPAKEKNPLEGFMGSQPPEQPKQPTSLKEAQQPAPQRMGMTPIDTTPAPKQQKDEVSRKSIAGVQGGPNLNDLLSTQKGWAVQNSNAQQMGNPIPPAPTNYQKQEGPGGFTHKTDPGSANSSDWSAYGGTGEAGSGFENFERFLTANQGAIKNTQEKYGKETSDAQATADKDRLAAAADWKEKMGYKDVKPEVAAPTNEDVGALTTEKETNQAAIERFKAVQAKEAELNQGRIYVDTGIGEKGTTPHAGPLSDAEKANQQYINDQINKLESRNADIDNKIANNGKAIGPTNDAISKARDADQAQRDLIAAKDFYETDSAKKLEASAQDAAKRTSELTQGYEGLYGKSRQQGLGEGASALNAALLGSGSANEQRTQGLKAAGETLGKNIQDTQDVAGAEKRGAVESLDYSVGDYNKALDQANAPKPPAELPKSKPSKSWNDYMGPWGTGPAGGFVKNLLLNPEANFQSIPNAGVQDVVTGVNVDPNKNRGEGVGAAIGVGGNEAHFAPGDEAVYNSMTDEEIHALERMNSAESRRWIDARKKQLGQ